MNSLSAYKTNMPSYKQKVSNSDTETINLIIQAGEYAFQNKFKPK